MPLGEFWVLTVPWRQREGLNRQAGTDRDGYTEAAMGTGTCAEKGLWLYKASESIEKKV